MIILENISMKHYTTFRMGGIARYVIEIENYKDIEGALAFARAQHLPHIILGGGSNIIFPDESTLQAVVIKIENKGICAESENDESVVINVSAGVSWDDFVLYTVEHNFTGIEMLSAIPGTVGATPVQNVGAYGGEVGNHIVQVAAYDTVKKCETVLQNNDCEFSYRDSIFKKEKNRYIILAVTFRLDKLVGGNQAPIPNYPGVKEFFEKRGIHNPTLTDIRNAITEIRSSKLPDPKVLASCGSFFKNPIVQTNVAERIKEAYPNAVIHDVGGGMSKVGAGWLIDTLELKGKTFGNLSLYDKNAVVLVNNGGATKAELVKLITYIQKEVSEKFGVHVEPEPVFV
jgi:UDP-N-acetylmuramate dehydrogenase